MNGPRSHPARVLRRDGRWLALCRLDDAVERNVGNSNAEKTERIGRIIFGELWDDVRDGQAGEIPERNEQ